MTMDSKASFFRDKFLYLVCCTGLKHVIEFRREKGDPIVQEVDVEAGKHYRVEVAFDAKKE